MELIQDYKNHQVFIQFLKSDWFRVIIKDENGKEETIKGFRTPHYMEVVEDVILPMIDKK
jgi:hypothetical protein